MNNIFISLMLLRTYYIFQEALKFIPSFVYTWLLPDFYLIEFSGSVVFKEKKKSLTFFFFFSTKENNNENSRNFIWIINFFSVHRRCKCHLFQCVSKVILRIIVCLQFLIQKIILRCSLGSKPATVYYVVNFCCLFLLCR